MDSRYQEIDRIEEEIRKAKEKELRWQQKKRKKLKEIQEAERTEREAWYRVITESLDEKFRSLCGALYWERLDANEAAAMLCRALLNAGMAENKEVSGSGTDVTDKVNNEKEDVKDE